MAQFFDAIQYNQGEVVSRLDVCPTGKVVTVTKGDLLADNGTKTVTIPIGSSGQILTVDTDASTCIRWRDPREVASGVVSTVLSDRRPISTTGGKKFSTLDWNTRNLNTLVDTEGGVEGTPSINGIKLIGTQIYIPPGGYFIISFAPVYRVGSHQSRLRQLEGTKQTSTITVNSSPTSSGNPDEHFILFSRSLRFTIYYIVGGATPDPPLAQYDTDYAHIPVSVPTAASGASVADLTATAINDYSGNIYINTSNNIYFEASSSGNVIIINHLEIGPVRVANDSSSSNRPGGNSTAWTYAITDSGTLTIDETIRSGTSGQSNSGAGQQSTVTSNIFHELVINSSAIYEIQHRIENSSGSEDFGSPTGLADEEVYTNCIFHKIS